MTSTEKTARKLAKLQRKAARAARRTRRALRALEKAEKHVFTVPGPLIVPLGATLGTSRGLQNRVISQTVPFFPFPPPSDFIFF